VAEESHGLGGYKFVREYDEAWRAAAIAFTPLGLENKNVEGLKEEVSDALLRAAAFETGAVEALYESAAGVTVLVAEAKEGWERAIELAGAGARGAFDDQYEAYRLAHNYSKAPDYPLGSSFLSQLHQIACNNQLTLDDGRPFRHGQHKQADNYAEDRFGQVHWYCPVEYVKSELTSGFDFYHELAVDRAPAILSAYLHWLVAHVHPFEDGNGRVARIIASIPTLGDAGVPVMVFADRKTTYLQALDAADAGWPQELVNYTHDRLLDMMGWASNLNVIFGAPERHEDIAQLILHVIQAQEEPAERVEAIVERVREYIAIGLQERLAWVLDVGGVTKAHRKPYPNSIGYTKADATTSLRVEFEEPISITHTSELTVAAEVGGAGGIGVYSGQTSGTRKHVSLRYADCTPSLSTEAELVLSSFNDVYSLQVASAVKAEMVRSSKARGTLPSSLLE